MCVLLSLLFLPGPLISSRTAMGERPDHLGNFNEKNTYMVGIPLSPSTMYVDHPNDNRLVAFQNDIGSRKRSNTSFQITSVTVQGSRTNTEDFEDSADDFEESHTDDISSDILDSSKFTEPDGYHSEDNTNPNNDDLSPSCGPMIITPLTPVTNESSGMNVGLGIDMSSPFPAIGPGMVNSGVTMMTSSLESPVSAQVPIMSPLLDNWQHRFKVVKIVSSEPFKRGRWVCMDFKDPPTAENSSRCSLPAIHVTPSSFDSRGSEEQLNVQNAIAHVFEIPASSAYADAVPIHSQPIQQFYGILLPQSNNDNSNNNPTAVMENIPILTDVNFNQIINENASQLRSHSHPLLFQTTDAAFAAGSSMVNMAFSPTLISNHVAQTDDKDVNGHDNIPHAVQSSDNASADADQVADDMLATLVPERITARNSIATEDIESRFCSLANQLSLTSGLSQSPPPALPPPPAQNVIPNGEYIGRPRTPSLAMTRESPPTICATPFTATQVAITSASVAVELPNSAASSGASTVAIDNKIEQAMDLVKSHLMFAVREEVEVLKEKITELLDRISQLEHENDILRANASPETLKQLNQSQKKFTVQQTNSHIQNQPPSS